MSIFLASFTIMLIAVAAMAIGVILSGRSIKGSCGGINTIEGLESACGICSKPCAKRKKALKELQESQ